MDSGAIAGWLVAIGTLGTMYFLVRHHGEDMTETRLNAKLKPIEERLRAHDDHHAKHFFTTAAAQTLMASMGQEIKDHQRQDDERFGRIEQMHKEIRDDIKELMQK